MKINDLRVVSGTVLAIALGSSLANAQTPDLWALPSWSAQPATWSAASVNNISNQTPINATPVPILPPAVVGAYTAPFDFDSFAWALPGAAWPGPVPVPTPEPPPGPQPPAPTPPPPSPGPGPLPPGTSVEACASHYDGGYTPILGRSNDAPQSRPRPAKGEAVTDSAYGTCVVRVTDHRNEPTNQFARTAYSRRQAFNADDSRVLVVAGDGTYHIYDGNTLEYIRALPEVGGDDGEPVWHPTDPDRLRFFPRTNRMQLAEMNIATGTVTTLVDFNNAGLPWSGVSRVWTRWEGAPSYDGRYWCLMAQGTGDTMRGVFTYDLETKSVVGSRSMSARPDHVSMSASGRHCVVSHVRANGGTTAYSRDFSSSRHLHAASEHSDLGLTKGGQDVYVFVDYDTDGSLKSINLDTGAHTSMFSTYISGTATGYHISARNQHVPGWVLMSTYGSSGNWLSRKLIAVELKANPTIINLGHHYSSANTYWSTPVATVNSDFTRVMFNSNWGSSSDGDIEAYMLQLPHGLVE